MKKRYFSPSRHKSGKQSFLSDSSACFGITCCKGDEGTETRRLYRIYNMKQCFSTTILPSGLTLHLSANLIIIFQITGTKFICLLQILCTSLTAVQSASQGFKNRNGRDCLSFFPSLENK